MKTLTTILLIALFALLFVSCSKKQQDEIKPAKTQADITACYNTYQKNLKNYLGLYQRNFISLSEYNEKCTEAKKAYETCISQ